MGENDNLNEAIRSLKDFIESFRFSDEFTLSMLSGDSTVLLSRGDRTIILTGQDADKYIQIKSAIFDTVKKRRPVSKKAINDLVDNFFFRILHDGDSTKNPNISDQLNKEAQLLKTALFTDPRDWEIKLIVEGIAPSGLPFIFGQVEFTYLDATNLSTLRTNVANRIRELKPRDVEAVISEITDDLKILSEKAIATISVNAVDEEAAIQEAKHKLQITVDAINMFCPRDGLGGWAFLPGDTMPQGELVLAFCKDIKLTPSFRSVGPLRKIPLNQIAKRPGFARLSDMLHKEYPTDLEDKILASVRWAGRAQIEARREEAFLLYAIALESLVLGKENKMELSYRLAVRCAQISGGSLEAKRMVVDQVRSLYDLRSKIVHSGNLLIGEEDVNLISRYAMSTLLIIIEQEPFRSMTTVRELETWFENQLLMGGVVRT